jgi:type II secretory pathway pseudopilin PulG
VGYDGMFSGSEMTRHERTLEELVTLQDKAIEALTQANAALKLALEALQAARREMGTVPVLPGLGLPNTGSGGFTIPYVPPIMPVITPKINPAPFGDGPYWTQPQTAPQWTQTSGGTGEAIGGQWQAKAEQIQGLYNTAQVQKNAVMNFLEGAGWKEPHAIVKGIQST